MNSFLDQLQSLDERKKTQVLVITTIVIMAIVIYFWLGYFNSIVSTVSLPTVADNQGQAATNTPTTTGQTQNIPGFFQIMGSGLASIAHAFGNMLEAPRKYAVKPN